MNDTLKWVLITLLSAIAVFAGGEALGVDWMLVQVSIMWFLETIGLLLLLFTGSAAAIEVAKFYRRKNRMLEEKETSAPAQNVAESDLRLMLKQAVAEVMETQQQARLPEQQGGLLSDVDFEAEEQGLGKQLNNQIRKRA